MKTPAILLLSSLIVLSGICGCGEEDPVRIPRPRAYPRVIYPDRQYVDFDSSGCPFRFRFPDYMKVTQPESSGSSGQDNPCWFDLEAGVFGATLHCSYYKIDDRHAFDDLVSDAFKIADRINQRSNYMDEIRVANARGVHGLLMEFTGSAASPFHFYLTDSTAHFFRASLYFRSRVVPDSLAPVLDFLREDIAMIINTMEFGLEPGFQDNVE